VDITDCTAFRERLIAKEKELAALREDMAVV
jgi:hypothetical protein